MKINYIKTVGFRKFKGAFETPIYNVTKISGKNRSGKSNILYAIVYIMLGTNLSGDEKACLINKKSDSSYGELQFTDNNGIQHTIVRGKNKYSSKDNFLALDGKQVTQMELTSFYKDKKLFLSILNPLYFLAKKPAEQKEMVDKYLSDIKPKEIFDKLDRKTQDALLNKYYVKQQKPFYELTSKGQEDFINLTMFNICTDIAYNNLSKHEQLALEGIPRDIPSYISELNADIKKAESLISSIEGKIEYAQNIAGEKLQAYRSFDKEEELSLAEQELSYLKSNSKIVDKEKQKHVVEELEMDILSKETELNELEFAMKSGKKKYLSIKNGETCVCPTCNQYIEGKNKSITISNMYKDLIAKYDRKNLLETQIKDLKSTQAIERCKYHALEGETTIEKTKRIAIVEENIKRLEQERQEIDKFNNELTLKEKTIKSAILDINKFNEEKQSKLDFIDSLNKAKKVAQKLYILYIEEKMRLAKQYLKDVDIKFYSVLKTTGEIKDDFIITYKNTPLSDLSRSETIATALEFANMFNKISRANFPIFIDDYESCADYNFIKEYSQGTQIITSKVEKGHLLKIADAQSDKCTIIGPAIRGCKTINTYQSSIANVLKVA